MKTTLVILSVLVIHLEVMHLLQMKTNYRLLEFIALQLKCEQSQNRIDHMQNEVIKQLAATK